MILTHTPTPPPRRGGLIRAALCHEFLSRIDAAPGIAQPVEHLARFRASQRAAGTDAHNAPAPTTATPPAHEPPSPSLPRPPIQSQTRPTPRRVKTQTQTTIHSNRPHLPASQPRRGRRMLPLVKRCRPGHRETSGTPRPIPSVPEGRRNRCPQRTRPNNREPTHARTPVPLPRRGHRSNYKSAPTRGV